MLPQVSRVSPVLGVRHVRRTAEYYRDVLGFSLDPVTGVFQPSADDPEGVYGIVKSGAQWIHFQIRRDETPPVHRQPFERDLYLYVDDAEGTHDELVRRGATIIQPLCETRYGLREFVIEDLNGFRLAFGQPI